MDLTTRSVKNVLDEGRTHQHWLPNRLIEDQLLQQLYEHTKMGPTSANCCPLRLTFVRTLEAKEKLKTAIFEGNLEKVMTAPVTVIFSYDRQFFDKMTTLFPHAPGIRDLFTGPDSEEIAIRNSSLQAAYFMMVARDYGLDCCPMSGFDRTKVRELFLADTTWEPNFICSLGYGDKSTLHPRLPRLSFNEACKLV